MDADERRTEPLRIPPALSHLAVSKRVRELSRKAKRRELRSCESRDLIDRARDACRLRSQPLVLNNVILDLAWTNYFGASATKDPG
jgi:hypothetical protein